MEVTIEIIKIISSIIIPILGTLLIIIARNWREISIANSRAITDLVKSSDNKKNMILEAEKRLAQELNIKLKESKMNSDEDYKELEKLIHNVEAANFQTMNKHASQLLLCSEARTKIDKELRVELNVLKDNVIKSVSELQADYKVISSKMDSLSRLMEAQFSAVTTTLTSLTKAVDRVEKKISVE